MRRKSAAKRGPYGTAKHKGIVVTYSEKNSSWKRQKLVFVLLCPTVVILIDLTKGVDSTQPGAHLVT